MTKKTVKKSLSTPRAQAPKEAANNLSRTRAVILAAPALLWLMFFMIIPMISMVTMSLEDPNQADSAVFAFNNYESIIGNSSYLRLYLRSFWIALIVTVLSILFAYPIASYLAFNAGNKQTLLLNILIVPAWTSFLLRVLAWRIILGSNGVISATLQAIGIMEEAVPVLLYSPAAVIITLVYIWIPFAALPIYVSLQRIEPNILEASEDLGARPWQTFFRVIFPLSIPGILAAFVFVFIPTVGEYVTPSLVGGPNGVMIGNIIWEQFSRAFNWPMGSAISLVMLLLILIPVGFLGLLVQKTKILVGGSNG
jgi:spermidine/putrescine transport system permease protein